ncbi:bifunctional 2-polyprenyl-6-hydroxyphenol methylase/3-demethylubiquinol 3-O-methyltransferase UbiG [Paraburkholderia sp. CNPSo 3281]|uniref:class I SAM-dependent methyltransferase n=1 Tax=Paraburkholderia sp. CNPSo 3281 TaxID=2940933 RepID=UPI0020B8039C|nr:methyltransferase domain-containing protein [Paraburkholderia sp. CNPSo 3281]MCP3720346.1 methyltransferase domain-containing protein [Paraburkholderia sp. CNPSo 3281]
MDDRQNSGPDGFYRSFEERYRGSRELIKSRLSVYLPFIRPLRSVYPDAGAVDLGCGRGEWLEILNQAGVQTVGVDLDQGMLTACHELGLTVEHGDALAYLSGLPDESQVVVSAFHVVEHISFDQLQTLVREALRVLKPGGLLIMETPNPENIVVATRNFYLDPTHQRPIPPDLLAFVPDYYRFARTKTLRLQESPELATSKNISLQDVLSGASPDYAIVAQKRAADDVLALLDSCFSQEYGLTLESLAARYDGRIDQRIATVESAAKLAESRALLAESRAQLAESRAQQAELREQEAQSRAKLAESREGEAESRAQLAELREGEAESRAQLAELREGEAESRAQLAELGKREAETRAKRTESRIPELEFQAKLAESRAYAAAHRAEQAESRAQQVEAIRVQHVEAIYGSTSWRITAPLRAVSRSIGIPRMRAVLRDPMWHAVLYVARRPKLKRFGMRILPIPGLLARLQQIRSEQLLSENPPAEVPVASLHNTAQAVKIDEIRHRLSIENQESEISNDEILRRIRTELEHKNAKQ